MMRADVADDEYRAMMQAGARLDLDITGARLVASSSRLIWHLPGHRVALLISRPGAKTAAGIASESAAVRAAVTAGVRTPRIVAGPTALPKQRHAMAVEWISGRPPEASDWPAIVSEAARLATAPARVIPTLQWPPDVPDDRTRAVLGEPLARAFVQRCAAAARAIDTLGRGAPLALSHGDLQPGNVVIDRDNRAWLIDLEYACRAPREWDPAKLVILARRFGDPPTVRELLPAWGHLEQGRLAQCVAAQEALLVAWLARMAAQGTAGAAREARHRAATLTDSRAAWRHLR
jgi:Ser/Thr protein kinase RdoA (MazF antagonist)